MVTIGFWVFAELSDDVLEGDLSHFDSSIMEVARSLTDISPAWVRIFIRDFTFLGSFAVLLVVSALSAGFLLIARKFLSAAYLAAAVMSGALLNSVLKELFERPRPDSTLHLVDVATLAYPSGHATSTAVVFLTLAAIIDTSIRQRSLRVYVLLSAVALSVTVGLSRIYLGVHYPTDVLAGWVVGLVWATVCWMIARLLQQRHLLERAGESGPRALAPKESEVPPNSPKNKS